MTIQNKWLVERKRKNEDSISKWEIITVIIASIFGLGICILGSILLFLI